MMQRYRWLAHVLMASGKQNYQDAINEISFTIYTQFHTLQFVHVVIIGYTFHVIEHAYHGQGILRPGLVMRQSPLKVASSMCPTANNDDTFYLFKCPINGIPVLSAYHYYKVDLVVPPIKGI